MFLPSYLPHRLQFLKARNLNSQGFKIALDLLVKAQIPSNAIAEVPFAFGLRAAGESKLTSKVIMRYLTQLLELYWFAYSGVVAFLFLLFFALLVLLVRYIWYIGEEPMITVPISRGRGGGP